MDDQSFKESEIERNMADDNGGVWEVLLVYPIKPGWIEQMRWRRI